MFSDLDQSGKCVFIKCFKWWMIKTNVQNKLTSKGYLSLAYKTIKSQNKGGGFVCGIYPRHMSQPRDLSWYGYMLIVLNIGLYPCSQHWLQPGTQKKSADPIRITLFTKPATLTSSLISNAVLFIPAASGLSLHTI